jgi:cell division protein FtsB
MIRRILFSLFILFVVYFAIEGGEWGTSDLWKQRNERQGIERVNESLTKKVDSLRRYRAQLDTDRALQEKLVRENLGMIRGDKELVYQLGAPDSTKNKH